MRACERPKPNSLKNPARGTVTGYPVEPTVAPLPEKVLGAMTRSSFPKCARETCLETNMTSLHSQVCKYVICIVQYVRDKLKVNKTYAFLPFLSFPRRRESSIWPFFNALDSRSPPSRGQASRE